VRRTLIRAADSYLLNQNVSRVVAQSATVRDRLARWNGVRAEVLHPPPPQRPYRCDGYGDYLFFTSRLVPLKRADLLIAALAHPEAREVRCVIGGDGDELPALRALADSSGVSGRVTFAGRLTDAALVDHLARCRAVVFVPKAEDYGFVTVEAFASGKAVITARDSGGPVEFVRDGENGFVVDPDAASLALACRRVMEDSSAAERMGMRARDDVADLTWERTVNELLR
jgi:glycosyltransferase involved in cell wall biosynthesis